jgi:competence protein ComEC
MSVNDNSLVVRVEYAGRAILFTGDLEAEGEIALVGEGGAAADVVKAAHHGSRTSSTEELVTAVAAETVVISCGVANRFGFPHEEVLERWEQAGVRILRTDRDGAVTVRVTSGGNLATSTFR